MKGHVFLNAMILFSAAMSVPLARSSDAPTLDDHDPRLTCRLDKGVITVDAPYTRRPTSFGILAPDDRFFYIVHPAQKIDNLAGGYKANPIRLDFSNQKGTVVDKDKVPIHVAKVFSEVGEYQLIFSDANRIAGEPTHSMKCVLTVTKQYAPRRSVVPERVSTCRTGAKLADVGGTKVENCSVEPNCGTYGCCTGGFFG